jgi:hypothetical protein
MKSPSGRHLPILSLLAYAVDTIIYNNGFLDSSSSMILSPGFHSASGTNLPHDFLYSFPGVCQLQHLISLGLQTYHSW